MTDTPKFETSNEPAGKAERRQLQELLQSRNVKAVAAEVADACTPYQRIFINMLAFAQCQNGDLKQLLADLKPEVPRRYQRSLDQLIAYIDQGIPVMESLSRCGGLVPTTALAAFQLAEEQGNLNQLFEVVTDESGQRREKALDARQQVFASMLRNAVAIVFAIGVVIFIGIRIMPEFVDMYEEFALDTPAALQLVNYFFQYFSLFVYLSLFIAILLSPIWLGFLLEALRGWNPLNWQATNTAKKSLLRKLLGRAAGNSDGLSAATSNILGLQLGEQQMTPQQRWDQATSQLLTKRESKTLNACSDGESRSWLLEHFAAQYQAVYDNRSVRLVKCLLIIAKILLALLVLLVAVAVFSVLIGIIEGLAP